MDFKKELVQESHAQRKKITELLRKMTKSILFAYSLPFYKGLQGDSLSSSWVSESPDLMLLCGC